MSLNHMSEVVPFPLVAGGMLWAALAHYAIAPTLADRVFQFDHRAACVASVTADVKRETRELIARKAATIPSVNPDTAAARMVFELFKGQKNSAMRQLSDHYGWSGAFEQMIELGELPAKAAKEAFNAARGRLVESAQVRIAKAPDSCACQAKLAFLQNHFAWSVWAGSGGFVKLPAVVSYAAQINSTHNIRQCRRDKS